MCVSLILSFIPLKTGSPISKLVLLKLADNADARGVCFPSLNYLAQYCEVSVRTVKRHVNELEKQGFVKRIKRFDDSGRQRSNIYQLRLPNDSHIQQADLSDTPLGDTRSTTEGDHLAHIIFHKEHKTDISCKAPSDDKNKNQARALTPTSQPNDAVIHLLTQEGSAPIYHEFATLLERSYPKLDVLQELHAMQAWLYINPDKRKPFEHIGHFVNGWLRRSTQAKAKQSSSPNAEQTRTAKPAKTEKPARASTPTKAVTFPQAAPAIDSAQGTLAAKPVEPKHPTPVSEALADYQAKSTINPFEARIKALVQSKSTSTGAKQ